jgi:hypothetical protein
LAYSIRFARRLAVTPAVAVLPGVLLAIPFSLAGGLLSLVLWWTGVWDGFWTGFLAITLAPTAGILALWFLTLPLTFAAMALHGGDAWEAQNRGLVWAFRGLLTYAPLGLLEHAVVAGLLYLFPWVYEFGWAAGVLYVGLVFALWTTADVLIAILVRHRVEATPISEHFRPIWRFASVISEQERALATKEG